MKSKNIFRCFCFLLLLVVCLSPVASGQSVEVAAFAVRNQSPLISIFGLPSVGNFRIAHAGERQLLLAVDLTSNYLTDAAYGEKITLDGESLRISLRGRWGLGKGLEIGMDAPFIVLGGGFLDDFLIKYHDLFGFPQGGRDTAARNRLLYVYQKNNVDRLRVDSSSAGIGDISISGGWQLVRGQGENPGAVILRAALKLPTGNSNNLQGSGSTDFALWLDAGNRFPLHRGNLSVYGAGGLIVMTEGKILPSQQRNFAAFGNCGIGWDPFSFLAIKIQADVHTPFYKDSVLKAINAYSVMLTVGGTLAFGKNTYFDIGVSEDLKYGTAPDVVFHLALRKTF